MKKRFLKNSRLQEAKDRNYTIGKGWKTVLAVAGMCFWVFVSVVAAEFVIGVIMIWLLGAERLAQPVWTTVYSALSYTVAGALIILVPIGISAKWHHGKSKKEKVSSPSRIELGLKGLPTWTDVGLAPVGFIVSLILAAGLVAIFSLFPWFNADEAQDVGFSIYMSGFDRVVAFITLVILAPVAEEVIFRGWLYGKMRERLMVLPEWASVTVSILTVSMLFGVMHGQWNVGVNVFCLSVVLCALREVTGTIYAGILTHMLKNGVAFYLLYVLGRGA